MSKTMKVAQEHPRDRAAKLLEYISDTEGAPHMMLSSRHLNFMEYYSLDLALIALAVFWAARSFSQRIGIAQLRIRRKLKTA